jgi:cell division protein FtsB
MTFIQSPKKHKTHRNQGIVFLNAVLIFAIIGLAVFYVHQVNNLVGVSYAIRGEKEKLAEEAAKNQKLETTVAQLKSPLNLEEMIKKLEMVEAGKIDYLKIEKEVAVRK